MHATEEKPAIAGKSCGSGLGLDRRAADSDESMTRRIMEFSRGRGRSRSRGCYWTATNPRITKRLLKRARGSLPPPWRSIIVAAS